MHSEVFLSILVPVYNWDISPLLKVLHDQCYHLEHPEKIEIIVVDDGSTNTFANSSTADQFPEVIYKEMIQNQGRSVVRNNLIDLAQGEYVIFLDADMLPDSEDFILTYLGHARSGSEVVCGGISYEQFEESDARQSFYLYKSKKTEALSASIRNQTPWRYVFTSNIMLRRDILKTVRFDNGFTTYGFEDVEWGMRLTESFSVKHIDNTCSHMGVMDKERVFSRMREASGNHFLFYSMYPEKVGFVGAVGLAKLFRVFPDILLRYADNLLEFIFHHTPLNSLAYFIFQSDKVVLLARKFKKTA